MAQAVTVAALGGVDQREEVEKAVLDAHRSLGVHQICRRRLPPCLLLPEAVCLENRRAWWGELESRMRR